MCTFAYTFIAIHSTEQEAFGRLARCPLLVECQASVSRGESTDKGQRVLPFIGGMRPLIGGRSVTPFCSLLWPAKPDFHAALPSQVAIFEHEAVRSGGQRPAAALESTD
jgi:hypothetical protein